MRMPTLTKVNVEVLDRYCVQIGMVPSGETLRAKVSALSAHMASAAAVATCDACGADSDPKFSEECPFCGEADAPPSPSPSPQEPPMKKTAKKAPSKKAPAAKKAPSKKAPAAKKAPSKKAPAAAKVAKPSAEAAPKAKATDAAAPTRKRTGAAIVPAPAGDASIVASAELTVAMNRVRAAQVKGVETMWELGQALYAIYQPKLHTQLRRDGKVVYDDWSSFVSKEFGITPAYGFKLMDVAANFSKEKLLQVGVTKLALVMRVPESERETLVEKAATTSRDKLAEEVRKLAAGKVRDTGRNAGFKGERGAGRPVNVEKSAKLTVVRSEPRVVVDLYKRGTTSRARDVEDAVGIETCANGVTVKYMLQKTAEGLSIAIETVRESVS